MGPGMSDAGWPDLVQRAAVALWPAAEAGEHRKRHTELAHIAGDLSRSLAAAPDAREDWEARDPSSLAIHDGFLAAAGAGSEAYRAWVEGPGGALLRERIERLSGAPPGR
jgi:hypothetical protein